MASPNSRNGSRWLIALTVLGVSVLALGAWFAAAKIEANTHTASEKELTGVLQNIHQTLREGLRDEEAHASTWAQSIRLREFTKELLETDGDRQSLLGAPAQDALRSLLAPTIRESGYLGFFVIGPNDINLASTRDQNIGVPNLLIEQKFYLDKLKSGESTVSLPQPTDVPLPAETGQPALGQPTMFAGAPIKDDDGTVIAALVFRIDPRKKFTRIMRGGRIGLTGETYAFDKKARLISESRFRAQLEKIGLTPSVAGSVLTTEIRDPGVNLLSGQSAALPRSSQPLTLMAERALKGVSGVDLEGYNDYRGVPVIGVWTWDADLNIGLATEMDVSEAYRPLRTAEGFLGAAAIATAGFMVGIALLVYWSRNRVIRVGKRFEALVTASTDVIAVLNRDAVIQFISPSVTSLTQYEPDDFVGRRALDFVHPEDVSSVTGAFDEVVAVPNSTVTISYKFRHKDGSWRDIETTGRNLLNDPIVGGVVLNSRDITDRKRTEQALREGEARFRAITENTTDITVILDDEGAFKYVSPAAAEITGVPSDALPGASSFEMIAPEDVDVFRNALERALSNPGETIFLPQLQAHYPDNRIVYFEVLVTGMPDVPGVEGVVINARDLTERRRASDELLRYEHIVSASPDMMSFIDRDYRYQAVNDAYERHLGVPTAEITGHRASEFLGAEYFDQVIRPKMDQCFGGESVRWQVWMNYQDLGRRFMDVIYEPVRDYQGEIVGLANSVRDITDLRLAEEELGQVVAERNMILENAKMTITVTRDRKMIQMDNAFEEVFGWRTDEFRGRDAVELYFHKEDYLRVGRDAYPIFLEGKTYETEVLQKRKTGTPFWARLVGSAVDPGDMSQGTIWLTEDISQRKLAEEELGQVVAERNMILENVNISINFNKDQRIIRADPAFEEMFGWNPEEEPGGLDVRRLYADQADYDKFGRDALPLLAQGRTWEVEIPAKRNNGPEFWARSVIKAVDPDDLSQGFIGLIEDINDRRAAEEESRHAQKLEALGQLTGGVAHDFNNLLGIILASVEIASDGMNDGAPDFNLMQRAVRAVKRGENLTKRLLAFSRNEALRPSTVDVNDLINVTSEMLRRTIEESIEVETKLDDQLWTVNVDAGRMEDALLNLAINSRDAMPNGGTLTIRTANQTLQAAADGRASQSRPGDFVVVSMTDTGTGMSAEILEHVFEPFFTTKETGKGSGLGLSMVYGFANQSDGFVRVDSELGLGTTVTLFLPRSHEQAVGKTSQVSDEVPGGNGEVIMVVEDDPDVRYLSAAILTSLGYDVVLANDGRDAMTLLEGDLHLDLLLSDIVMPGGMNGADLLAEAQKLRPDLKGVLMSGYTALPSGSLPRDIELLHKPFPRRELAEAVRNALDLNVPPKGLV